MHARARLAVVAGGRGIGVLDGPNAQFTPVQNVQEVAIAASGPPVFAAEGFVSRLDPDRSQRLAVIGGDLVDGSLAIEARVTWRTKDGAAQSTPLGGETAAACDSGTTLLAKDGLRVFEVLLADARLFACQSGAPVLLVAAPRDTIWTVAELAREDGRIALFARTPLGDDRMISLGADARAGVPTASVAYGEIRDLALAPDGRIAVALHSGHRWTVTVFALGAGTTLKRERTLAHPRKGVRRGSLAFAGTRILWRDSSGAAHSTSA
jgi:hypothetical protein